jgi:hypothetical protein
MAVVQSCTASLQPSAPHRHEQGDPTCTARCPACGHAVEIEPFEPGETESVWRFAYHDSDGNTLVMRSRGSRHPWRERVVDPHDL